MQQPRECRTGTEVYAATRYIRNGKATYYDGCREPVGATTQVSDEVRLLATAIRWLCFAIRRGTCDDR